MFLKCFLVCLFGQMVFGLLIGKQRLHVQKDQGSTRAGNETIKRLRIYSSTQIVCTGIREHLGRTG